MFEIDIYRIWTVVEINKNIILVINLPIRSKMNILT